MSKEISKQEKEDYLSLMYEMKRKENQIVKSDLSRELEVPLSRVTRVTDGLLEEGYLLKDEDLNEMGYNTYLTRYLAGYRPVGTGTHIDNWTLQRCTECEYNGGNKNKPSFWPNDHQ